MARIAGIDLPKDKRVEIGLTYIYGIGRTSANKILAEAGISARIINMATIKPLDEELVLKAAKECGKIITCEEHNILGGLGEAVCGLPSEK